MPPPAQARPLHLEAPLLAAGLSATFLLVAGALATQGLGGGVASVVPTFVGLGAGALAAYTFRRRWSLVWALPLRRRAVWLAAFALLMLPFTVVAFVLATMLLAVILYVRP